MCGRDHTAHAAVTGRARSVPNAPRNGPTRSPLFGWFVLLPRVLVLSLIAALLLASAPARASTLADDEQAPVASVIVQLDAASVGENQVVDARRASPTADDLVQEGVVVGARLGDGNVVAAEVTAQGLAGLQRSPAVELVRPARDDLRLLLDRSVPTIGAAALHEAGVTGTGRVVAVIDSGVAADHPALAGSVVAQACFLTGAGEASELCADGSAVDTSSAAPCTALPDDCSHGTAVAGVISGRGTNESGAALTGVAPDAGILAIRVTAVRGSGPNATIVIPEAAVLQALEHVYSLRHTHRIDAVNLSIGGEPGTCRDAVWEDVIGRLVDAGIAVVAASGNAGRDDSVAFPACLPDVVAVGATTSGGDIAAFTNSARELDLLAPGSPIQSSVLESFDPSGSAAQHGTSFAAPHVAAAFALAAQSTPSDWSVTRRRNLLRATGAMVSRVSENPFDRDPRFPEIRLAAMAAFEPFADAGTGYWVHAADWAKATGVSTGVGGNTFGPRRTLSRAQAVTFLWRLMGSPAVGAGTGFADVDVSSWYGPAVAWAAASGVTTGTTPSTFAPEEAVSRAQLATFMWRTAGVPRASAPVPFDDVRSGRYYADAVEWLVAHDITTGTAPTTFSPDDPVTRAQMVTFAHRLAEAHSAWTGSVAPPALALF